jgi:16S rRNA (guanine966-N2)-methyltransferase
MTGRARARTRARAGATAAGIAGRDASAGGSAGRVIAGVARGRRLVAPGKGTRPLGDRVKQSLFAILEPEIRDQPFLDLFAGSGAAGIEALSRGASFAAFVEHSREVTEVIRRNLQSAGLGELRSKIVVSDAITWLGSGGETDRGPFAAIFADPPYDQPQLLERALDTIAGAGRAGILAPDGVVVAKHSRVHPLPARIRLLRSAREERFGETMLTFYRWSAPDEDEEVG